MLIDTNNKILIYGNGWLGNRIKEYFGDNAVISLDRIENVVSISHEFSTVINCAAKTNIDWCEKNKKLTHHSNIACACYLAELCKEQDKKYVFISSACIFESKNMKDIKFEDSEPNPKCFYAETKAMAEKLVQEVNPDCLIVRVRLPISSTPHERNTLNKLLKYDKINTNKETVTVIEDMLPKLESLIKGDMTGVYHLVNKGTISPTQMAKKLGHTFTSVTKKQQDKRLAKEGKTKRVTTYVSSRYPSFLLPDIRRNFNKIAKKFKELNK